MEFGFDWGLLRYYFLLNFFLIIEGVNWVFFEEIIDGNELKRTLKRVEEWIFCEDSVSFDIFVASLILSIWSLLQIMILLIIFLAETFLLLKQENSFIFLQDFWQKLENFLLLKKDDSILKSALIGKAKPKKLGFNLSHLEPCLKRGNFFSFHSLLFASKKYNYSIRNPL